MATSDPLEGLENPPNADKDAPGYVNPCLGRVGYEAHRSEPTGLVKNEVEQMSYEVDGAVSDTSFTFTADNTFGVAVSADHTIDVVYVHWRTGCAPALDSSVTDWQPGATAYYWIKRPTQDLLVPSLLAEVIADLEAPQIVWPNKDPEFGWVYVNVDNDIRISPVDTVRKSRSRSNLAGTATAWIEASPSMLTFDSGEPGKQAMECSYESATAPYVIERATSCFHRYTHSSAISTTADNAFVARASVAWEIRSSGPLTYSDPISWRQELIQVAEVQSLVIATD